MPNKKNPLPELDEPDISVTPLILTIMRQLNKDAAFTSNALIDSLQYQNNYLRAQLDIIRETISDLANSDTIVNPNLYFQALNPSEKAIERVMKQNSDIGL